jgi:hypothetical protein
VVSRRYFYERESIMRDSTYSILARLRPAVGALVCALAIAACSTDRLLRVDDPDVANPATVAGKDKLPTQLAGLIGDFQVGVDGSSGSEGLVNLTGLLTDEFSFTETFPTRIVIDERRMTTSNVTLTPIFFNIQRARASGERTSAAYNEFDPDNAGHSHALSLTGFAEVFLAETYCSGVPFTSLNDDGSLSNNDPLTTEQALTIAVAHFDSAITIAQTAGDANLESLARVGRARALMDLGRGDFADAAAAVSTVPTEFEYVIHHSANTGRENNGEWEFIWNEGRWSQADLEGANGLDFRSAADPRTPFTDLGRGFATNTRLFGPDKYSDRANPMVLASGVEARLIEAEAALDAGQPGTWLDDLNALRSGPGLGLGPLADPGTPDARLDLMFRERAFWLYATGHRLGDMRRLSRSVDRGGYGRDAETVFPTGTYIYRGTPQGTYGTDVNFPIPIEEGNNPASKAVGGCIDRNP